MTPSATPPPAAPQADADIEAGVAELVARLASEQVPGTPGVEPQARPQIRIDPAMVAETLQRKNAQLMSQLVYDNAVLETALETAHRRIQELETQNEGLRAALGA
jgi:hypothetical protein